MIIYNLAKVNEGQNKVTTGSTPNQFWFGIAWLESIFAEINIKNFRCASSYLLTVLVSEEVT